jgi:hypothetical protein
LFSQERKVPTNSFKLWARLVSFAAPPPIACQYPTTRTSTGIKRF